MRRVLPVLLLTLLLPVSAHAGTLRAGAGRADVTPPNGYYMMGWVDSRAKPEGVWTRLYARALVLERDGHKVRWIQTQGGLRTIAGTGEAGYSDGSPATLARLNSPTGLVIAGSLLWFADEVKNRVNML